MADEKKDVPGAGTDERVKSLEEALSLEKAKNEVLMEQVLKSENTLAEKDVEGYADVIPNEDRDFWRGQLLENREAAVGILNRMRERVESFVNHSGCLYIQGLSHPVWLATQSRITLKPIP